MSARITVRHRLNLEATAILVAGGVLSRSGAVDALTVHRAMEPLSKEARDKLPKGYVTARSWARMIAMGEATYPEGEHAVAFVIAGQSYDNFAFAEAQAAQLLALALRRFDKLRVQIAGQLQDAISQPDAALQVAPEPQRHAA